ncbi:gephyrin-like molybdotransferase receptor GlpR [Streptomyces longwoodensis]|uniref:divisome protein SepX/GlpR n=1 Tax=Streptomyces longwoodensis TaxID=68231 RepID=UPI0033D7C959
MSSSGLIYAVIVGAWAAYLVPMWLRRQDELNEARPTERFSTAIRLLSGRAAMERRYAKDLRTRSTDEAEPDADPDAVTDSVDVRAFAVPPTRPQTRVTLPEREGGQPGADRHERAERHAHVERNERVERTERERVGEPLAESHAAPVSSQSSQSSPSPQSAESSAPSAAPDATRRVPRARRAPSPSAQAATARAQRSKVLARRRRTTVMLFLAFTLGAVVAAVGGLTFLWAPGVPAVLLSGYIAYLRAQERRRFTYQMDRRQAEAAAQRLRERQPRRRASASAPPAEADAGAEEPDAVTEPETDPGLLALAADRRALVEQTDHAEWVDQQRERQRHPGQGDSWDPVPVPLPTYVTAPVAPRATADVDLGAPDTWSSARSSAVAPDQAEPETGADAGTDAAADARPEDEDRSDARRAASARRSRERGRTPLFDQYEDGERPRAANE